MAARVLLGVQQVQLRTQLQKAHNRRNVPKGKDACRPFDLAVMEAEMGDQLREAVRFADEGDSDNRRLGSQDTASAASRNSSMSNFLGRRSSRLSLQSRASTASEGSVDNDSSIAVAGRRLEVIDPTSKPKVAWDLFMSMMIVYSTLAISFRLAFGPEAEGPFFVFDVVVDICFGWDIVLTFFTGYYDDHETKVTNLRRIALRYIRGYFFIDMISAVPVDRIIELISPETGGSSARAIRIVRLARLTKVARLFRSRRFMELLEQIYISMQITHMVKVMCCVIFLIHLLACFLYWTAAIDTPTCSDSRSNEWDPCREDLHNEDDRAWSNWIRMFHIDGLDLGSRYLASFYYTTATLMAVGYGELHPANWAERIFSVVVQLIGAVVFGFILSAVTQVIESVDPHAAARQKRLGEISEWMESRNFPLGLQTRLWSHFNYSLARTSSFEHVADYLTMLPTNLRTQIVESTFPLRIEKLRGKIFDKEPISLLTQVAVLLQPLQVTEGEIVVEAGEPAVDLFVVSSGTIDGLLDEQCLDELDTLRAEGQTGLRARRTLKGRNTQKLEKLGLSRTRGHESRGSNAVPPTDAWGNNAAPAMTRSSNASTMTARGEEQSLPAATSEARGGDDNSKDPGNKPAEDDIGLLRQGSVEFQRERFSSREPSRDSIERIERFTNRESTERLTARVSLEPRDSMERRSTSRAESRHSDVSYCSSVFGEQRFVLCAIFGETEYFSSFQVSPLRLQGGDFRSELLALPRESLEGVLAQFPDSFARFEAKEEAQRQLLWEAAVSSEISAYTRISDAKVNFAAGGSAENQQRTKSRIVFKGRIAEARDLHINRLREHRTSTTETLKEEVSAMRMRMSSRARSCKNGRPVMRTETEEEILARWVIPPYYQPKIKWDFLVGISAFYCLVAVPFRFGFDIALHGVSMAFDVVVDIVYLGDLFLSFRSAFPDTEGILETRPAEIQRKYLRGWFAVDLLSALPFDWLVFMMGGTDAEVTGLRFFKLIRVHNILRIPKLAGLLKMGSFIELVLAKIELSTMVYKLSSLCFRICVLAHLIACIWFYLTTRSMPEGACDSGQLGCTLNGTATTWVTELGPNADVDNLFERYFTSLYWVFTTMTTVGYGDITPTNDLERGFAVAIMIFGATVFGYIISSIAAISVGESQSRSSAFSFLRHYAEEQSLSKHLLGQAQRHYDFCFQETSPFSSEAALLTSLSPPLRQEAILHIHREIVSHIPIFRKNLPDWLQATIVEILQPEAFGPGEDVIGPGEAGPHQDFYFVHEGICEGYAAPETHWRELQSEERPVRRLSSKEKFMPRRNSRDMTVYDRQAASTTRNASVSSDYALPQDRDSKILEIFLPGAIFGYEDHLSESDCKPFDSEVYKCGLCVRVAEGKPAYIYTLRQRSLIDLHNIRPAAGIMVQEVLADTLLRDARSRHNHFVNEQRARQARAEAMEQNVSTGRAKSNSPAKEWSAAAIMRPALSPLSSLRRGSFQAASSGAVPEEGATASQPLPPPPTPAEPEPLPPDVSDALPSGPVLSNAVD